ncbi:hypothetical protein Q7P37_010252 [Cladosporium fusiforme]
MPTRWNPCTFLPRRLQIVASLTGFVLFCILFLGTSSSDQYDPYLKDVPYATEIQSGAHQAIDAAHQAVDRIPKLPNDIPRPPGWLNPFKAPAHTPPPEQANSTSGSTRWYSDWKWQNPFSSSITFDEERSVLPPEKNRPPIYTFFDVSANKNHEDRGKHQKELLEIWRRAWWAKGFKPVVLGPPEAKNNPQYGSLMRLKLGKEMETELMRWLAWQSMGTGILCNWLAVPMGDHDDPLISFMRRGEYPKLTRYGSLDNGLFVGSKEHIDAVVKATLANPDIQKTSSIFDAVPSKSFTTDKNHDSIAFYSTATIKSRYAKLQTKLETAREEGLADLALLINSHLHTTSTLIAPAIDLARNLSQCSHSPDPSSCPPNARTCTPCVATSTLPILTPPVFRNQSKIFTIATVPHPYTQLSLKHNTPTLDLKFLRRHTTRDAWILAATKELLGTGISSFARLVAFKDAVASDFSAPRSLWLTAEDIPTPHLSDDQAAELDWVLGFTIPRSPPDNGRSETPVPGPERRPPPPKQDFEGPEPSDKQLAEEAALLASSRFALEGKTPDGKGTWWRGGGKSGGGGEAPLSMERVRNGVEAWNLADTEAWKFVRAFGARRAVERAKWEEDEERFLGEGVLGRWVDKVI